jgi:hypothetical protein
MAQVQGDSGTFVVPAQSPYDRQMLREHIELLGGVGATLTIDGNRWQLTRRAAADPGCATCTRRGGHLRCSRDNEETATCIDCVIGRAA